MTFCSTLTDEQRAALRKSWDECFAKMSAAHELPRCEASTDKLAAELQARSSDLHGTEKLYCTCDTSDV